MKIDDDFRKSSLSGVWAPIACVEVKRGKTIQVRDSKANGNGPVMAFNHDEWKAFIDGVKAGEFDL